MGLAAVLESVEHALVATTIQNARSTRVQLEIWFCMLAMGTATIVRLALCVSAAGQPMNSSARLQDDP